MHGNAFTFLDLADELVWGSIGVLGLVIGLFVSWRYAHGHDRFVRRWKREDPGTYREFVQHMKENEPERYAAFLRHTKKENLPD